MTQKLQYEFWEKKSYVVLCRFRNGVAVCQFRDDAHTLKEVKEQMLEHYALMHMEVTNERKQNEKNRDEKVAGLACQRGL